MINEVIVQKLQYLDKVLAELRSLGQVSVLQLQKDWRVRRAVGRDMHILVEIVVDVCQCLLSIAGQAPAATGAEAVRRSIQLGALSDSEAYRNMIRIRSLYAQRRERIDEEILVSVVSHRLPDFAGFKNEVLAFASSH